MEAGLDSWVMTVSYSYCITIEDTYLLDLATFH